MYSKLEIVDFVCIPEDFEISTHLSSMRNKMGFFEATANIDKYYCNLESIKKINKFVSMTGFIKINYKIDVPDIKNESRSIITAMTYLFELYKLGLIVESIKYFSFKELFNMNTCTEYMGKFFNDILSGTEDNISVNIINVFPLYENKKYYMEKSIESLLVLDKFDLEIEKQLNKLGNIK